MRLAFGKSNLFIPVLWAVLPELVLELVGLPLLAHRAISTVR